MTKVMPIYLDEDVWEGIKKVKYVTDKPYSQQVNEALRDKLATVPLDGMLRLRIVKSNTTMCYYDLPTIGDVQSKVEELLETDEDLEYYCEVQCVNGWGEWKDEDGDTIKALIEGDGE